MNCVMQIMNRPTSRAREGSEAMQAIIASGSADEVAALVVALQERQEAGENQLIENITASLERMLHPDTPEA